MARPKRVVAEERQAVAVTLRHLPFYAVEADILPGIRGVGETPEKAIASMRSELRRRYPFAKYDIEETVLS